MKTYFTHGLFPALCLDDKVKSQQIRAWNFKTLQMALKWSSWRWQAGLVYHEKSNSIIVFTDNLNVKLEVPWFEKINQAIKSWLFLNLFSLILTQNTSHEHKWIINKRSCVSFTWGNGLSKPVKASRIRKNASGPNYKNRKMWHLRGIKSRGGPTRTQTSRNSLNIYGCALSAKLKSG